MRLTIRCMLFLAVLGVAAPEASAFEKIPYEVAKALKVQTGKPVDTGLVFVDGKYLKPPYRVKRYGNQICVNSVPVTGPLVSWEDLLKTQDHVKVTEVEVTDGETPSPRSEKPNAAPVEDGVDPAAPKDGGNVAPPADESAAVRKTIAPVLVGAAADDLEDFKPGDGETMKLKDIPADTEEDKARRKKFAEENQAEEEEGDAEEESKGEESKGGDDGAATASDEPLDPASPEGEAAAKREAAAKKAAPPAPKKMRKVYSLEGDFVMNNRAQKMLKPLEIARARIEAILRRGGYIFFSTRGRRVTGEAIVVKKLLEKLPKLMRDAKDAESFCDAVRNEGLMNYMNLQNAQDLYRNKMDFHALMERRRALVEEEKLKKLMNR